MFHAPPEAIERTVRRFREIHSRRIESCLRWAAYASTVPSVMRVFRPGSRQDVLPTLLSVAVDELRNVAGADDYRRWYIRALDQLVESLQRRNRDNTRVQPGLRWGHATKILSIYVREVLFHTRYFTEDEYRRTGPFLYVPFDSIVMRELVSCGVTLPFFQIKSIDSEEKFFSAQDLLFRSAEAVGTWAIWFDDVWAARST